jgi:hypothetical protein
MCNDRRTGDLPDAGWEMQLCAGGASNVVRNSHWQDDRSGWCGGWAGERRDPIYMCPRLCAPATSRPSHRSCTPARGSLAAAPLITAWPRRRTQLPTNTTPISLNQTGFCARRKALFAPPCMGQVPKPVTLLHVCVCVCARARACACACAPSCGLFYERPACRLPAPRAAEPNKIFCVRAACTSKAPAGAHGVARQPVTCVFITACAARCSPLSCFPSHVLCLTHS